jgi:ABC-2 type transport system permease protein
MGPLDWGPVIGGYAASLFLAAAYVSIGLYMSGRTDNPIVALILTVACAGAFCLIGSSLLTTLFDHRVSGILELLGSGSRFQSIQRGVLDCRDIYYYVSIVGVFLTLNLLSLERIRWAGNKGQKHHRQWIGLSALVIANLLLANFWLHPIQSVRIDLTEGKSYSLSQSTKDYLGRAVEPLLIRGYFSMKSHPLLEPMVPQIKDLLEEYQIAGGNRVRVEFVDPHSDPEVESEAAETYGIRPRPFRMASRYESGVVNSYFDLVIAYGDQYETLSFDDLIEFKSGTTGEPEVLLLNPEYAITRSIRKVISGYRADGDLFDGLKGPVMFRGYLSPAEKLPKKLAELRGHLETLLPEMKGASGGKFAFTFSNPETGGPAEAERLYREHGFVPQITDPSDPSAFWFYMVLEGDNQTVPVPLPPELSQTQLKNSLESALKRMAPGYLKTVALVTPVQEAPQNPYLPQPAPKRFNRLRETLSENVRVIDADLSAGRVPVEADMLLVLAPQDLSDKAVFAVDQFLMQGGTVLLSTSPFNASIGQTLTVSPYLSGLEDWLDQLGLKIENSMILDPQNTSLPMPVQRQVGSMTVNEIVMMPYPHFPDVRGEGMNSDHPSNSGLQQMTFNWASPLTVDADKNKSRTVTTLFKSSPRSWKSNEEDVSSRLDIIPDYTLHPKSGFAPGVVRNSYPLAVAVQGIFESRFKAQDSPLLAESAEDASDADGEESAPSEEAENAYGSVMQSSSDSARLVLIASNAFAEDFSLSLVSQGMGMEYTAPLAFIQNVVDLSLDDHGLLSIRGRSRLSRTLEPMTPDESRVHEYANYGIAVLGLGLVWSIRRLRVRRKTAHYKQLLAEV